MKSKVILLVALAFSIAIVHLMINVNIAIIGYDVDNQAIVLDKVRSDNRNLAARAARGESLDRIESVARTQLKMVTPERIKYIIVTEESK